MCEFKIIWNFFEAQREQLNYKNMWIWKFKCYKYLFMIWFKINELVTILQSTEMIKYKNKIFKFLQIFIKFIELVSENKSWFFFTWRFKWMKEIAWTVILKFDKQGIYHHLLKYCVEILKTDSTWNLWSIVYCRRNNLINWNSI